jgi:enamine deaminase RidA (YjgF/YER057c/UK114 family)
MPRQIIMTADAPSSPLYSQGVKAGPHVLVSGIVGIDPSTGGLAGETIQDQTRQAMTNCQAILRAGGASLEDVVEVGVLLANPADFAGLNEEYARSRSSHRLAMSPSSASNCPDCSSRSA